MDKPSRTILTTRYDIYRLRRLEGHELNKALHFSLEDLLDLADEALQARQQKEQPRGERTKVHP